MSKIVYVTSNTGKIATAQEKFLKHNLDLEWYDHDCNEPEVNDIESISKYKAVEAYQLVGKPCFVVDSGFYIEDYPGEPGFPGAFPKRLINNIQGEKDGIDLLLEKMINVKNRTCRFIDCLTYYDGKEFKTFYGVSEGTLAYEKRGIPRPRQKSKLWFVFIPKNETKTLCEMSDEEYDNRKDEKTDAVLEFIDWYKALIQGDKAPGKETYQGKK